MASQHDGIPTQDSGNTGDGPATLSVRIKIREFLNPIVRDGLVVGKKSPIDGPTLKRAMGLLINIPFEFLTFEDDTIGGILVRSAILKRIPRDRLIRMAVQSIKPCIEATEVVQMEIDVTASFESEV